MENQEIVRHGEGDFADNLLPGYRFCPTDSELIVHYLKRKIQSQELPPSRIHEVYIYNYYPQQLAESYRATDNEWYFLTPRKRIYAKGNQPNTETRAKAYWRSMQKQKTVYDDVSGEAVGWKRNLTFFDENKCKTMWVMKEYNTNVPNLPFGNGENGNQVISDWVLCKIYKTETNPTTNTDQTEEEDENMRNEGEEEPHDDEASTGRRRRSETQDKINQRTR